MDGNLASIELHTSLARASKCAAHGDVFDLDPGPADILDCGEVALAIRKLLDKAGLECWAKTSGSKGMQLYVPLNTAVTFDDTKGFALEVARRMAEDEPDRIVTTQAKVERSGKVLIDWSQNDDHKTTVSVYSLRAKSRPTVRVDGERSKSEQRLPKGYPCCWSFESVAYLSGSREVRSVRARLRQAKLPRPSGLNP